jgi:hypothetical protein
VLDTENVLDAYGHPAPHTVCNAWTKSKKLSPWLESDDPDAARYRIEGAIMLAASIANPAVSGFGYPTPDDRVNMSATVNTNARHATFMVVTLMLNSKPQESRKVYLNAGANSYTWSVSWAPSQDWLFNKQFASLVIKDERGGDIGAVSTQLGSF